MSIKGHNPIENQQKITCNYSNLYLFSIKTHTKFDQILSIHSQDIEQKQNFDIIIKGHNYIEN